VTLYQDDGACPAPGLIERAQQGRGGGEFSDVHVQAWQRMLGVQWRRTKENLWKLSKNMVTVPWFSP